MKAGMPQLRLSKSLNPPDESESSLNRTGLNTFSSDQRRWVEPYSLVTMRTGFDLLPRGWPIDGTLVRLPPVGHGRTDQVKPVVPR